MKKATTVVLTACALSLTASAAAQSINFSVHTSVGPGSNHPDSSFGAAANQPGHWNAHVGTGNPGSPIALNDLDGNPTGVTMEVSSQFFALSWFSGGNLQGSTPDQQSLLAGYWDLSGIIGGNDDAESFTFTGLENGTYDVYTYAMSPSNATYLTRVNVNMEADPGNPGTQVVGGAFSGDFELGVTHSLHTGIDVTDGTLVIHTLQVNFGSLAGIQLRRVVVGDLTGDGSVGVADLLILLASWGPCKDPDDCPADLDGDGSVGVSDLLILLANWG